jgi:AAA+ ATPase superfamily predicted ATPase
MFVDRQQELTFLNGLLTRKRPGPAQMVLMYGRRRVGKSELLLHWAEQSGLDYVYWEAVKENAILRAGINCGFKERETKDLVRCGDDQTI